ncbi:MAG: discoidin domain-containing protein [Sphingomonadales bacterium]|nr:discoidin domain-containing protein [Sphingomonadales bacterium]
MSPINIHRRRAAVAPLATTTWSPTFKGTNIALSGGNLVTSASAAGHMVYSTDWKSGGKYRFEVTIGGTGSGLAHQIGVMTCHGSGTAFPSLAPAAMHDDRYGAYVTGDTGNIYLGGNPGSFGNIGSFGAGATIAVEIDTSAGTIQFCKSGGTFTAPITIPAGKYYCPVLLVNNTTNILTANFGASPWAIPASPGYGPWTKNASPSFGRYWRFCCVTGYQGFAIAEAAMKTVAGGANVIGGGTASASSTYTTLVPAQAIDGNPATIWGANSSNGNGEWWMYDFAAGNSKANIQAQLQSRNDFDQYATQLLIMGSQNNADWFPAFGTTGLAWARGETKTFTWG